MPPALRSPWFRTVRGRLFLLIAALLGPALLIIAALSWEAYRSQRAIVQGELANTARAVAGLVDTEIDRAIATMRTLSAVRSLRERDWPTLDNTARRALPEDGGRWLVVVELNGRQLVNTALPRGAARADLTLDPGFVAAMREGEIHVSDVLVDPVTRRLVVRVGMPIVYADGTRVGLGIELALSTLSQSLDVGRFARDGAIAVLDRDGRIIVRAPHRDEFIGSHATPDIVALARGRVDQVVDSVTLEGVPVATAFVQAKSGWSVVLGTPQAKLSANAQRLLLLGLALAAVATLAAAALATRLARAVVRSVDELARDAERLARGESVGETDRHLREIQVVAQAMRQMAATRSEAEAQLREARDRLREYAHELERKVEERTESLRGAVAQMEEFSYTVSHDIRAPLRAMSAFANALLEEHAARLDEQGRDYLRRIARASERLSRMTSDLLTYSRVAQADVRLAPVHLEPIVHALQESYPELGPQAAQVTLVTPFLSVRAHEASLTQALANLLANAAKFVRPGERPEITVRTERREQRVRIWIEDRGIGIPPAHQERLFRIFERAPGARTYDGTGVGLAIVRKLVEKMGGRFGVESEDGAGSRFWIELEAG